MMSTIPGLMVLYSNDAVEVRFVDGSCLQLSPCGSTFVHHESPRETIHPVHGMKSIHQRCQFSTSDYKQKVIQALDFRNRFAEQPFVCADLVTEDQIVPLYANVKETAWPKAVKDANYEFLPDGSIRLISEDEFASLVLSPHKQDFTVCYLSKISDDTPKQRNVRKSKETASPSDGFRPHSGKNGSHDFAEHDQHNKKHISENPDLQNTDAVVEKNKRSNESNGAVSNGGKKSNHNGSQGSNNSSQESSFPSPRFEDSLQRQLQDDLCISPISVVSSLQSRHTSPESKQEKETYKRYSTPTEQQRNKSKSDLGEVVDIGGKKSAFRYYTHGEINNSPQEGSFLETLPSNKQQSPPQGVKVPTDHMILDRNDKDGDVIGNKNCDNIFPYRTYSNNEENKEQLIPDTQTSSSPRCYYTWITKHFSCDECPLTWRHPVSLAQTLMDANGQNQENPSNTGQEKKLEKQQQRINRDKEHFCFSVFPNALPLTCPSQHLHKLQSKYVYDQDKNLLDNFTTFKQGKMKVLMLDGVVYRILRLTSTKVVEIFPGDGTVILSQGVTGHYYRHVIPIDSKGKVEERSYSVKSLPPTSPQAAYSIQKLVKRANRFLIQANQEDKMLTNADMCCWKPQPGIVEPMQSTLLEECSIPGHGRFSAYSNGYVRILFEDRTSLDMNCDFSKRIEDCLKHSDGIDSETHIHMSVEQSSSHVLHVNPQFRQGVCKLLLQNGQYQVVDVKKPGLYRRYTDAALEWASWVNSSPAQRTSFYKDWQKAESESQLVAKELKKIKCFNYIVDNTVKGQPQNSFEDSHHHPDQNLSSGSGLMSSLSQSYKSSSDKQYKLPGVPQREVLNEAAPAFKHHLHTNNAVPDQKNITSLEMLQGFNSVREALLKTSKVISDIDDILDKRKSME